MVGLFCHFCPYTFSSPGRGAPEPWTTWRSKVPSLLDHPQWSPFLQQRMFTAAWVKATTFKCPHFCTELIHRLLLQSKAKVQVLHSFFFWKSGTILQLLHPDDAMKVSPASPHLTPAEFMVVCITGSFYEPANSCETLSGTYFSWLWINPRSHTLIFIGELMLFRTPALGVLFCLGLPKRMWA